MSGCHIFLSEDIYQNLVAAANYSGVTPEDWIAARLPQKAQPIQKDRQWKELQKAFGTWGNDEELDQIFTESNFLPDSNS